MDRPSLPPPSSSLLRRDSGSESTTPPSMEGTPKEKERDKDKERPLLAPTGLGRITPRSACEPCRSRKIKCSGERPSCARCTKQGKDCVYANATTSWSYIAALEERIRFLEGEKAVGPGFGPGPASSSSSRRGQAYKLPPIVASGSTSSPSVSLTEGSTPYSAPYGNNGVHVHPGLHSPPPSYGPSAPKRPRLHVDRDRDSEHRNGSPPYRYRSRSHSGGSENNHGHPTDYVSSHRHLAPLLPPVHSHHKSSIREIHLNYEGEKPLPPLRPQHARQSSRQSQPMPVPPVNLAHIDKSILPSYQHIHDLLQHFVLVTNSAYPLFHLPTLQNQLESVCFTDEALPPSDIASVLLVLAIGAASLPRSSPLYHLLNPRAEMFVHAAMPYMAIEGTVSGLTKLQIMLTHLVYAMYTNAGNMWDLSGAAMRLAVELGLHHEHGSRATMNVKNHLEKDMGRRLFWIAYSFDRLFCAALLRPPSIPDAWINAGFPSIYDDSLISETEITPGEPSPFKTTPIHVFKIRILQSEILSRLFTSSTTSASPTFTTVPITSTRPSDEWYKDILCRLEAWREFLPEGKGLTTIEWRRLLYHHTMTLLFQPSPANRNPGKEAVKKTMSSSVQTIKIYKDMYRMGRLDFPWVIMHAFFLQGVTYLDALWRIKHNGWNIAPAYVDALLDVQMCSSMLEALAAATPGTSGLRNTFEAISERVIRHLTDGHAWPGYQSSKGNSPDMSVHTNSTHHGSKSDDDSKVDAMLSPAERRKALTAAITAGDGRSVVGKEEEEGPLDLFLLHPMGDMTGDEWTKMVDRALSVL
ncbi:hypothetical protein CI109_102163 [Kwoniella shandongensis]|uniref:Uncharacterized protein n=1 Tax=Kwoniella shandongensis TaxID=1734106 RepID=A0A5M6BZ75_9TREE|nr:uncharacterized protein CI109_003678 [Kwoniella shandongensis]KAA5528023.1 hypothetical protein CI109_003678 [Kwoniella shandongensis]